MSKVQSSRSITT